MNALVLALALVVATGSAFAQRERHPRQSAGPAMSQDERQRMRQDMREVYRERGAERPARSERPRQLTPEERESLRRDVQNANRDLRR